MMMHLLKKVAAVKYLLLSCVLLFLYLFTLHPDSGFWGGMFFITIEGWTIPSLVNLSLSAAITFEIFLKIFPIKRKISIFFLFISVSLVLGINTKFVTLYHHLLTPQTTLYHIKTKASVGSNSISSNFLDNDIRHMHNMFLPDVGISGSSGCMCVYFNTRFSRKLWQEIRNALPNDSNRYMSKDELSAMKYSVTMQSDIISDTRLQLLLKVYEGETLISWLEINNFLYHSATDALYDKSLTNNFYSHAVELLMHTNFWNYFFGKLFVGSDGMNEVNEFFNKAFE